MAYTTPGDPRFREVEETITFQLRFPSGVLANCTSSYGAPFNRFRVVGTKGWAELEPALSYAGLRMRAGAGGTIETRGHADIDQFAAEMDHFSGCVMHDTDPKTPGEEGLKDLTIMMAIYQAARERTVLKL
jgi:predicted dehydrogenase